MSTQGSLCFLLVRTIYDLLIFLVPKTRTQDQDKVGPKGSFDSDSVSNAHSRNNPVHQTPSSVLSVLTSSLASSSVIFYEYPTTGDRTLDQRVRTYC